jgi:hypothetical protein
VYRNSFPSDDYKPQQVGYMTQAIEIQNLTAAVIGLGIALLFGFTAIIKWLPDYIKRKSELRLKTEEAELTNDQAEKQQERDEQASRWRLLESSIQNQSQLTAQIALMVQQHERELNLIAGVTSAVDAANSSLNKLDTYTRNQLEPIFQLIQAIHKIAETNQTQGRQSLEINTRSLAMLEALKENLDNTIAQIKKRDTGGDSKPIPIVSSIEVKELTKEN